MALVSEDRVSEAVHGDIRGTSCRIILRRDIPALPEVVVKALGMLGQRDLNLRILAGVLSDDPALAARIFAIGRSAYYRQRAVPATLQAALQVIGLRDLRNIIFFTVARSLFHTYGAVADALWSHSLAAALAGRILAAHLPRVDPEQAFLAGLLHDMGQVIFMHDDQKTYSSINSDAREKRISLVEAEQARYGVTHEVLGVALIESWNLDPEIAAAVAMHHGEQPCIEEKALAGVVVAADYLTLKAGLGFFAPAPVPTPEILRTFGFDNELSLTQATIALRHAFDSEGMLLNTPL
jgi:putative nucleotidyltransferase with HDIG domain